MACRLATCPTRRSPVFLNPTTEGVVRPPSSLAITLGSPPSMTATTELVVPRSMPIIFPMGACLLLLKSFKTLYFSLPLLVYNRSNIILECNVVKVLDEVEREDVAFSREWWG